MSKKKDEETELLIEFIPDDFSEDEYFALMLTLFAKTLDSGLDHERAYEYIYQTHLQSGITVENVEELGQLIRRLRTNNDGMH